MRWSGKRSGWERSHCSTQPKRNAVSGRFQRVHGNGTPKALAGGGSPVRSTSNPPRSPASEQARRCYHRGEAIPHAHAAAMWVFISPAHSATPRPRGLKRSPPGKRGPRSKPLGDFCPVSLRVRNSDFLSDLRPFLKVGLFLPICNI